MSGTKPQIKEAQQIPSSINIKGNQARRVIFKLQKIKHKKKKIGKKPELKNNHIFRGTKVRIKSNFSSKTIVIK